MTASGAKFAVKNVRVSGGEEGDLVWTENNLNTAVANAIDFFKESREPHALLWLAVMYRRGKTR